MGSTEASVFDGDIHIQTLHIGSTVKSIPANAFYGCSGIGTVTIPASVSSIGSHAFAGCSGLTSITAKRAVAPVVGANAFDNIPAFTPVYIPCGSTASYASRWSHFTNFVEVMDAHVWVRPSDVAMGTASVTVQPTCATPTATIVATPNAGYLFALWSDGDTLNPRTLTIDRDTLLTALFVPVPDTVINYDTIVVHDTVLIHDTTVVNNYIHDTTVVHDTAYVDVYVHDTTIVNNYIHDTTIVNDTTYVDVYVHDTTIVNNYIHDTTIVNDTTYVDVYVHDTTIVNNYIHDTTVVHDTTYIDVYVHDTTYVDNYVHDTIMIRVPIDYYTLTLVSEQPSMGIVVGSGTYSDSTEVEIAAVAICGYHFVQWSDGNTENPRHMTVTGDLELSATFANDEVGITDVPSSNAIITVQDNVITVQGAEGQRVRIFDAVGRLLSTEQNASGIQHFRMTAAGVYLVQVGDGTAQRVVTGIAR
ncbi:MAG: leucine-rich repeat domain-containing protein [Bacteroidales bacterium]|nr:leucine-rich repeat domain-containing protein [Bacteroidales bacterium]